MDELLGRSEEMCRAERLHREGKLPKRITHCDTKVNNMLFDQDDRFLCVIDLDTTMPGFVLSDFGDFIRTAANKGAEDDKELDRVGLDMEIFREFARGYLETASAFLTPYRKTIVTLWGTTSNLYANRPFSDRLPQRRYILQNPISRTQPATDLGSIDPSPQHRQSSGRNERLD